MRSLIIPVSSRDETPGGRLQYGIRPMSLGLIR